MPSDRYKRSFCFFDDLKFLCVFCFTLQTISDFVTPEHKQFSRSFEEHLNPAIDYLMACRPFSVSMNNAHKYIMWYIKKLPNNTSDGHVNFFLNSYFYIYLLQLLFVIIIFSADQRKIRKCYQ